MIDFIISRYLDLTQKSKYFNLIGEFSIVPLFPIFLQVVSVEGNVHTVDVSLGYGPKLSRRYDVAIMLQFLMNPFSASFNSQSLQSLQDFVKFGKSYAAIFDKKVFTI